MDFVDALREIGVQECCLCSGARNSSLIKAIQDSNAFQTFDWFEERSAAFFALGKIKATKKPVAVVTTSGTAAAELLPAIIEASYLHLPLLAVTADRPVQLRGTGAAQTIEQVALYGTYTRFFLEAKESFCLKKWDQQGPAHLNIPIGETSSSDKGQGLSLQDFLTTVKRPLVIVSSLPEEKRESVLRFLLEFHAPVYLEALSGLQRTEQLQPLRVFRLNAPHQMAIDGVLRIGGMPTTSFWRQLEQHPLPTAILSHLPFSGLSWTKKVEPLEFPKVNRSPFSLYAPIPLKEAIQAAPKSESALLHQLSKQLKPSSFVYLGNSLPIREWDQVNEGAEDLLIEASRGANGIDGQLSTFLGSTRPDRENWAILGDLTAFYDLAGFWALSFLADRLIRIVVINNGGGKIFSQLPNVSESIQNPHTFSLKGVAKTWQIPYLAWQEIPNSLEGLPKHCLIELFPDWEDSLHFWKLCPLF